MIKKEAAGGATGGLYNKFSNLSILQVDSGASECSLEESFKSFADIREIPEGVALNFAFNL